MSFANGIGIKAKLSARLWKNEFLPGILVWRGALFVNPDRIRGYGDIAHELGHLATLPGCMRRYASGDTEQSVSPHAEYHFETVGMHLQDGNEDPTSRALVQSGETEATAWAFAMQRHLNLMPLLSFSIQDGLEWRDASASEISDEIAMLSCGNHFGVHGLAAAGMTTKKIFPEMIRWTQP